MSQNYQIVPQLPSSLIKSNSGDSLATQEPNMGPNFRSKYFTRAEYNYLHEIGFFNNYQKVELLRGEIILMAAKRTPHSACNSLLVQELIFLLNRRACVRCQAPIILPADSQPEPDLVIARNRDDNYLNSHPEPQDILLVIEVSDTTLDYDRNTKLSIYAEDRIAEYWIFNLVNYQLEMYSQPYHQRNGNFSYRRQQVMLPDEVVNLPSFTDLSLDLSRVFP